MERQEELYFEMRDERKDADSITHLDILRILLCKGIMLGDIWKMIENWCEKGYLSANQEGTTYCFQV